jgi:tellurite resistance protein TerC
MGTWTLWIGFNAGVALLLLFDLGLFHRQAHAVSLREAALESILWVSLSVGFGLWIFVSHGRGLGLEFFTGYVIEKSLSVDNVFVFILVFQYFRVDARYQHRLLFWGVLGALLMRGVMIGAGAILIQRFDWILYGLGAFLLYGGFKLYGADHAVHPEKNPLLNWAGKILPMSNNVAGPQLFVQQAGRWLATPLLLVVIVLETTDLALGVDSVAAVFGVTRDPFLIYTSNACAILGLRAFYFLLVGILPYFQYLDEGLAIVLMFIGAKMLAEPWIHISTGISLAIVGGVIAVAVLVSIIATRSKSRQASTFAGLPEANRLPSTNDIQQLANPEPGSRAQAATGKREAKQASSTKYIQQLGSRGPRPRAQAAGFLFSQGIGKIARWLDELEKDEEFRNLLVQDQFQRPYGDSIPQSKLTVGIAVLPETFNEIREANGSPLLAEVPSDQDALEFELEFEGDFLQPPRLDILTTNAPGGDGAIARFLNKFGEGIQQVEIDVSDVDRATEILRVRFHVEPIYPATRPGANGTRVNFFLVTTWNGTKVLVELVEHAQHKPLTAG